MNRNYLIQLTPGCIVRKTPISEPFPVTQLMSPLGKPARWKQCTIWRAETAPWKKVTGDIYLFIARNNFRIPSYSINLCVSRCVISLFLCKIPVLVAWVQGSFQQLMLVQFLKQPGWQDSWMVEWLEPLQVEPAV